MMKQIDFTHVENDFVDFSRYKLIYHMISSEGPHIAIGDVNNDGLEDFHIGGAKDQAGQLLDTAILWKIQIIKPGSFRR